MHHFSPARIAGKTLSGLVLCLLSSLPLKAQLSPASNPDVTLSGTAFTSAPAVACDMLQTSTGRISVIAWDDNSGGLIWVNDAIAGSITIPLPAGAANPDVVLADDMSNPGTNYIVAAVYLNSSGGVMFETFTIMGAGTTGGLTYASNGSNMLSPTSTSFPHIDMFADINNPINGLPSMHEYVLTWGQGFGGSSVMGQYGDIATPSSPYNVIPVFNTGSGSLRPDVAASYDQLTGKQFAYFAIENNSTSPGLTFASWDVATGSAFTTMLFPGAAPYLPHIEAMGVFDASMSPTPWVIAAPIPMGSNVPLFMFDKIHPSGVNCSTVPGYLDNGPMASAVGVGAGITPPGAYYCNDNYTIGWHSQVADYVTKAVDHYTGNLNGSFPFYYQVSPAPAPGFQKESMAISSTSNLGKDMLTAWYDGLGNLKYKYTIDITAYKPGRTGIGDQNIAKNGFAVYPNPASDKVVIEGQGSARISKVEVYNMLGQSVHIAMAGNSEKYTLSLRGLASGTYSLKIYTDKEQAVSKLVVR